MNFEKYKEQIMPLCPLAIKLNQHEVHAPGHHTWGTVTCDCGEKFAIGKNLIFGSRLTDVEAAKRFQATLADDHKHSRQHQNSYEIRD